jgi:hypothetical protein
MSDDTPNRPPSTLDYAVFLALVGIVVTFLVLWGWPTIHDTFTNLVTTLNQP